MLIIALFFLFGLIFGSFLNVVIYRLPLMMERAWSRQAREILEMEPTAEDKEVLNLAYPPSHCPSCHALIRPWSNIPIISFLLQGGKCAHCHQRISWRYPAVELLTGVCFALVGWKFGLSLAAFAAAFFTAVALAMIFIDARTQLLPDILTYPLLWIGLLINTQDIFAPLSHAVWGGFLGYMSLWIIFQIFKLFTGKEGMGFGDFKLLAALGAWFGVFSLPIILGLSAVVGLIFAVIMKVSRGQAMPFGPYLALSGWLMLMNQAEIMSLLY